LAKFKENILVTGGSGFIGKNICHFFKEKYNIISPTHEELDLLCQNQVKKFFKNSDIDYVIHCANIGGTRKSSTQTNVTEKNIRMFFNLIENKEYFIKMIHLGSGAEYNKDRMNPNIKEKEFGVSIPQDEYGFSKYVISKYIENSKENIYCLRLFGVFGPYEDYEFKFISNAIIKNFLHMPIKIMQNVHFDWLFIDDLLQIIDYFIKKSPSEHIFNVTSGKTTDLVSIAKIINKNSDFKSDILIMNKGLNREYSGNNNKLMSEIGKYDFNNMENSIKKLMEYYKSNIHDINREIVKKDHYAAKCKINK